MISDAAGIGQLDEECASTELSKLTINLSNYRSTLPFFRDKLLIYALQLD